MPVWRLALKNFVNLSKKRTDPHEENERQPGAFARLLRLKGQNKNLYDKDTKNHDQRVNCCVRNQRLVRTL
jgi:hypothetical protein